MQHLILSCSLSPTSHSALMADRLAQEVGEFHDKVRLIDLRRFPLPFCDGTACYADPNVLQLQDAIGNAVAITIAAPIHNFGAGAAARNVVALGGDAWNDKVVCFLCAAGGQNAYMGVMGLANSLMLDFRCIILPRFVYATKASFADGRLVDSEVEKRIAQLASELRRLAAALTGEPRGE